MRNIFFNNLLVRSNELQNVAWFKLRTTFTLLMVAEIGRHDVKKNTNEHYFFKKLICDQNTSDYIKNDYTIVNLFHFK